MRVIFGLLVALLFGSPVFAQSVSPPSGCVAGVACQAASIALSGQTVTASAPALSVAQTWNNAGATFTAATINITDTASGANSKLIDMLDSGVSRFSVSESGQVSSNAGYSLVGTGNITWGSSTQVTAPANGQTRLCNNASSSCIRFDATGTPVPTGTGTPTMTTGSTDTSGEVTAGATATSIVITFTATKTNAPFCLVVPQTQLLAFAYTVSATAITITQTATSGNKIDYWCPVH